jgi:plastocyanin
LLSLPSKLLFAVAGLALALAAGYAVAVGERSGVALLVSAAVAAAVLGGTFLATRDTAPFVAADAPPPDARATTPGAPGRGSVFPLLSALAVGIIAVGAAVGAPIGFAGLGVALLVGLGWFGKAWSEHPTWVPRVRERVSYRFLVPFSLPLLMLVLVLVIAVSMSRVLLAIDKEAATVVAIAVAIVLLTVFWVIAARPRMQSGVLTSLAVVAGLATIGAGVAGAVQGEREFHSEHHDVPEVHVTAKDVAFDKAELVVPAGEHVKIHFDNHDPDMFHNVAIYESSEPDAKPLFNGLGFAGIDGHTYDLKAPEAGTYVFVCDFHINMKGQFVAE